MEPGTLLIFFMGTKVALVIGMGWIVASGLKRWEELERAKRAAAETATLAVEPATEAPDRPVEAPEEVPAPVRRAA